MGQMCNIFSNLNIENSFFIETQVCDTVNSILSFLVKFERHMKHTKCLPPTFVGIVLSGMSHTLGAPPLRLS